MRRVKEFSTVRPSREGALERESEISSRLHENIVSFFDHLQFVFNENDQDWIIHFDVEKSIIEQSILVLTDGGEPLDQKYIESFRASSTNFDRVYSAFQTLIEFVNLEKLHVD